MGARSLRAALLGELRLRQCVGSAPRWPQVPLSDRGTQRWTPRILCSGNSLHPLRLLAQIRCVVAPRASVPPLLFGRDAEAPLAVFFNVP